MHVSDKALLLYGTKPISSWLVERKRKWNSSRERFSLEWIYRLVKWHEGEREKEEGGGGGRREKSVVTRKTLSPFRSTVLDGVYFLSNVNVAFPSRFLVRENKVFPATFLCIFAKLVHACAFYSPCRPERSYDRQKLTAKRLHILFVLHPTSKFYIRFEVMKFLSWEIKTRATRIMPY